MQPGEKIHINAIAFQEDGTWIAQGIEYDIVAHADDVLLLLDVFARKVMENVAITIHLGRKPLQGIPPAPESVRRLGSDIKYVLHPMKQPEGADIEMRIAA